MHALSAPALWLSARAMLAALYAIVGDGGVSALARLTRKQRREALDWLKPLEIMVRKLLLIEAYGLSASRTPARLRAQQAANSARARPPVFALLAPAARRLARRLGQSGRAQNCALARAIANAFCRPQPALFRIRDYEAATQHARRVAGDTS